MAADRLSPATGLPYHGTMETAAGPTPDAPPAPPSPRYHDLDALRAAAMLLGIVLHAALFLYPDAWPILDKEASESLLYDDAITAIHGFRMPVFFLLSGFFTAMLVQRRGLRGALRQRLQRVGLPLAAGMVTVIPLTWWVWAFVTDHSIAGEFPEGTSGVAVGGFFWLLSWLRGLNHLWFLWHLLWLVGLYALLVRLGVTASGQWAWWALVPLTFFPQVTMAWFGADTSDGLLIAPNVLSYYALFFLFGACLHQRDFAFPKWWAAAVPPTLLLLYPLAMFLLRAAASAHDAGNEGAAGGYWALASATQVAYTWLMCFGLMGLFRWIAAAERPWVRYVSDASYWLYLVHLPLVILGQWLVLDWAVSVHLKFALIVIVVTAGLMAVYAAGVRHTPIGAFLNGPRPRRRPRRDAQAG